MQNLHPAFKPSEKINKRNRVWETEFERYHSQAPVLRPLLLKTVDCFVVDRNNDPVLLPRTRRQRVQLQATRRYFYEVARIRGGRFVFVEWSADGFVVELRVVRSLREALRMYDREPGTVMELD